MIWLAFGGGAFLGGIIGAAIGAYAWTPIGIVSAFACGVLACAGVMMLVRGTE